MEHTEGIKDQFASEFDGFNLEIPGKLMDSNKKLYCNEIEQIEDKKQKTTGKKRNLKLNGKS